VTIQEWVPKYTLRIVVLGERTEIGHARVERWNDAMTVYEKLSPVGTSLEGSESTLDCRKRRRDRIDIASPREMEADSVYPVCSAQPQVVCRHGADLTDLQHVCDRVAERSQRFNGVNCVASIHEIFRLDFIAIARRERKAEMWKTFMPWSRNSELLGAVVRRHMA